MRLRWVDSICFCIFILVEDHFFFYNLAYLIEGVLFYMHGYASPYRLYRNSNGGGISLYIRENTPFYDFRKGEL